MVKIVTGIRRCGKSFLLFKIFKDWLLDNGVSKDKIIMVQLDDLQYEPLHDPYKLLEYVKSKIANSDETTYVMLDEIQLVDRFVNVLLSLMHIENIEIYVTGSNSKFLSSDVITEFRGRGDEIRLHPLTISEYVEGSGLSYDEAIKQYFLYGGLPQVVALDNEVKKKSLLKNLVNLTYIKDVIERNKLKNAEGINTLVCTLASAIGSFTNPRRIADTFKSNEHIAISDNTIRQYIGHLADAFIISETARYDIKGRRYIGAECKYYFEDLGIRNVLLNFRQSEETHIMENVIYNELVSRGLSVDVGVIEVWNKDNGSREHRKIEVDFVVNQGYQRWYIQSAYSIANTAKQQQEIRPFRQIADSFAKILIVREDIVTYKNDDGVLIVGLETFLRDPSVLS